MSRRTWIIIALVAAVSRAAAVIVYDSISSPRFFEYHYIALSLLRGEHFVFRHFNEVPYRSYVEPLYVFITYAVYFVSGESFLAMSIVNATLAAAVALVTAAVAKLAFGPEAAVVAGLATALDPALVRYAAIFHPVSLDALLIATVVLAVLAADRAPTRTMYVGLGVTSGLCLLSRPTIGVFLVMATAWLLLRRPSRRDAGRLALAVVVAALVVAPWVGRNYATHGRLMLTRSNGAYVFWLGNNPAWTGTAATASGENLFEAADPALRQRVLASGDEIAQNEVFREAAVDYLTRYPAAFVGRTAVKMMRFWTVPRPVGTPVSSLSLAGYRVFYTAAATLALVGIVITLRQHRRMAILLLGLLLSVSVVQSMFYVEGRHRIAVEPILLVFSAAGLVALMRGWRGKVPSPPGPAAPIRIHSL